MLNHKLLTINYKKTTYVPFSCNRSNLPDYNKLEINAHNSLIEISGSDFTKYLGVYIDKFLRWDVHINTVTRTLRSILYKFKFLNKILDVRQMKIIYHALVESRLSYGILGWGGALNIHLSSLEIVQKRFIKIMLSKPAIYSTDLLFSESRLFDVKQLFFLHIVINQYRNRNNLQLLSHAYPTRAKSNLQAKIPDSVKTIGQRSHNFLSPRLYNFLPIDIRQSNTIHQFKHKCKTFILNTKRDQIHCLINIKK